jgi:hypothetical protein
MPGTVASSLYSPTSRAGDPVGAILLVRHGQASFGGADYDVLSSSGERQARRLAGPYPLEIFVYAKQLA